MDLTKIAEEYLKEFDGSKDSRTRVRNLKETLRDEMPINSSISIPDMMRGVQLTQHQGEKFDVKAFALEHPELYQKFLKPTEFVKLTTLKLREEDIIQVVDNVA